MSALRVEFLAEAVEEARAARAWYAQRSIRAAVRFDDELDRAVEQIGVSPLRFPEYIYGTRRYLMYRFPYLVVYRIERERVEIVAVQHGRRRPGYWRERLGP
jgi:plasmid stabilization system protein ParE